MSRHIGEDRQVSVFGMTSLIFYNSGKSSTPGPQQPSDLFQGNGIPTSLSCQPCFLFRFGFLSLDFFFDYPQMFSIGFRSGLLGGQPERAEKPPSLSHLVVFFARCEGAPSCARTHGLFPAICWISGTIPSSRVLMYSSAPIFTPLATRINEVFPNQEMAPATITLGG